MRNFLKISLAAFLFGLLLPSCGGGNQTSGDVDTTTKPLTSEKLKEYPIPTPFEVTKMLNEAGAGYIVNLLNSNQNVYKYETEKKQALNLGVYGADLCYASTYNKTEETRQYISCSQDLTDKLNIKTSLGQGVVERIEANLDKKDTLYNIITATFKKSFNELNNSNRGAVSSLILAGGWLEGLYISSQLVQTANNKKMVMQGIAQQKSTLQTLIATLKTYQSDDKVKEVLADLLKINAAITNEQGEVTDEQLKTLIPLAESVRKKIIE